MNTQRLYEILHEVTTQYRKGEVYEGSPNLVEQAKAGVPFEKMTGGGSLEVYAMEHTTNMPPQLESVDVHFMTIGVDAEKAKTHRDEIVRLLAEYPAKDRLAQGPSYIEVGGVLGSQDLAFQLFAVGDVLGFWNVITPETLGFSGSEGREMAGRGLVMISGYDPKQKA